MWKLLTVQYSLSCIWHKLLPDQSHNLAHVKQSFENCSYLSSAPCSELLNSRTKINLKQMKLSWFCVRMHGYHSTDKFHCLKNLSVEHTVISLMKSADPCPSYYLHCWPWASLYQFTRFGRSPELRYFMSHLQEYQEGQAGWVKVA